MVLKNTGFLKAMTEILPKPRHHPTANKAIRPIWRH